jgi:TonB family protein
MVRIGLGLWFAMTLGGQTPPASNPGATPRAVANMPRLLSKVEPQYSEEARKAHLQGSVSVKVVIDADGNTRDPQVVKSLGLGLDENPIAAVSKWRFQAGTKDGQPKSTFSMVEVTFRLASNWHLERADFHAPPGALRPVVQRVTDPRVSSKDAARAALSFDVDEHGVPIHIQIDSLTDENWADDAVAALKGWRFTPANQGGEPIPASCSVEFVRGN